jgi:vacuolar protein sorting-associated protein 52
LADICIPPTLATLILDTEVGEPWLTAIPEFEKNLDTVAARARVKAARDVAEVAEGLRIVVSSIFQPLTIILCYPYHYFYTAIRTLTKTLQAATKIRAFFLSLLHPIRASVTTNMQVLQTSVLLKYRPLFAFLQIRASAAAAEIQRAYAGAARTYYETGFRRYIRSLTAIKVGSLE